MHIDRNLVDEKGVLVIRVPLCESMVDLVDLLDLLEVANDVVTVSAPLALFMHCLGFAVRAIVQNEHHSDKTMLRADGRWGFLSSRPFFMSWCR